MQVQSTRMYRVGKAAGHFHVSAATIYRAMESGQLDTGKRGNGTGTLRVTGAATVAHPAICAQAAHHPLLTAAMPPVR